jgi:hypothetical protein
MTTTPFDFFPDVTAPSRVVTWAPVAVAGAAQWYPKLPDWRGCAVGVATGLPVDLLWDMATWAITRQAPGAHDLLFDAAFNCFTGGAGGTSGSQIKLRSRIGESPYATKLAQGLSQQGQQDVDSLLSQFRQGNENPGTGTRALGNGFIELRGRNGGRAILKKVGGDTWDIVGKFQGHTRGDAANSRIIETLMKGYTP